MSGSLCNLQIKQIQVRLLEAPRGALLAGKRYATNAKPMEKLQVLVEQVCRQAKCEPGSFNGQLYINGSKADLDLPVRLANIPSSAKIEVKTGALHLQFNKEIY